MSDEPAPIFTFDGAPERRQFTCGSCDELHDRSVGFVLRDDAPIAVYFASWSPHHGETNVEMAIGSWDEAAGYPDHVTFGTRIGEVDGSDGLHASLVPAGVLVPAKPMFGTKLSADAAIEHPWSALHWELIDWAVENDPVLQEHVFSAGGSVHADGAGRA